MNAATATERPDQEQARSRHDAAVKRRRRLVPLAALAVISFGAGAYMAAGSPQKDAADRFTRAWAGQDFEAMYAELSDEVKANYSYEEFATTYLKAQRTGTAEAINPGDVSGPDSGAVTAGVAVRTSLFDVVEGDLSLPFDGEKIAWAPHLTFPGLQEGERLGRRLEVSDRAAILAADGTPLAQGQGTTRSSPLESTAIDVVGELGEPDAQQAAELSKEGYPPDTEVGTSGLERAFNTKLAGIPGGQLLAVRGSEGGDVPASVQGRVLATSEAQPGKPVKTTIDPAIQEATVDALAGRFGGAVVLDAKNGQVKALAGAAYSEPAPPGSTFKIITTTAALEDNKVSLDDSFEVTDGVEIGRRIENSEGEFCGGTFADVFAKSCNTAFAPLGIEVGEERLVETAEKYGWNKPPELFNEEINDMMNLPESSIPTELGEDVEVGVTAIGQGKVLATPLQMASVAQTIAARGMRSPTPITTEQGLAPPAKPVQVTTPEVAETIRNLMVNVVSFGTGQAAFISGTQVAGKTGTAELGPKPLEEQPEEIKNPKPLEPGEEPPKPEQILDAWFTAFAPAQNPKLVVCVFLANAEGDGGEVAAPAVREIFEAAL